MELRVYSPPSKHSTPQTFRKGHDDGSPFWALCLSGGVRTDARRYASLHLPIYASWNAIMPFWRGVHVGLGWWRMQRVTLKWHGFLQWQFPKCESCSIYPPQHKDPYYGMTQKRDPRSWPSCLYLTTSGFHTDL